MLKVSYEIDLRKADLKNRIMVCAQTFQVIKETNGPCHQSVPEDRRVFVSALRSSSENYHIPLMTYKHSSFALIFHQGL